MRKLDPSYSELLIGHWIDSLTRRDREAAEIYGGSNDP